VQLSKHHGLANDFLVVLDEVNGPQRDIDGDLAARLCDRRRGIGADGLIHGATPSPGDDVDVVMHLFNADGSRAEMSGNGIRCLGQAVAVAREVHEATLRVRTDAGVRTLMVHESIDHRGAMVSVNMGPVGPGPEVPPSVAESLTGRFATADLGNPHLVVEVDDPGAVDLAAEGAWLEQQFEGGINIEFVAAAGDDSVSMRVWERGVGVTEACGTGACAAGHVAHGWGLVADRVRIVMPGGSAEVELGDDVVLIGPAQLIATVELPDG